MILKDFIEKFILKNTLVRLWYETLENQQGDHEMVLNHNNKYVIMEWEVSKARLGNHEVIGVTDILCNDNYSEAVNIVISRNRITALKT